MKTDSKDQNSDGIETDQPEQSTSRRKKVNIHLGEQTGPTTWRAGMEIANPVHEGLSKTYVSSDNIVLMSNW